MSSNPTAGSHDAGSPLVTTDWLAERLGDPSVMVFETTVVLAPGEIRAGRAEFDEAHIPGSRFMDLTTELSDTASDLWFTAPAPGALQAALESRGVGDGTTVVFYDRRMNMWATRAWWLLRSIGVDAHVVSTDSWLMPPQPMGRMKSIAAVPPRWRTHSTASVEMSSCMFLSNPSRSVGIPCLGRRTHTREILVCVPPSTRYGVTQTSRVMRFFRIRQPGGHPRCLLTSVGMWLIRATTCLAATSVWSRSPAPTAGRSARCSTTTWSS